LKINTVALIVNHQKLAALEFAHQVIAFLTERDVDVRVDEQSAPLLGRDDISVDEAGLVAADLIVTLGGDGTIIGASRIAAKTGTPILGVHMGRFGFIAESHPNDVLQQLDLMIDHGFSVEERMMVEGEVVRDGKSVHIADGLNEIVLSKGSMARMLQLETAFGGDKIATYLADGLVVATPTGSTAYALSAGGPLVHPAQQALLVVPICPHTLNARPLILPADEVVTVTIGSASGESLFIADSADVFTLAPGDEVIIRRSKDVTRLVTFGKSSFYRKIRNRLLWLERLND
jgi:NAD+ kinase